MAALSWPPSRYLFRLAHTYVLGLQISPAIDLSCFFFNMAAHRGLLCCLSRLANTYVLGLYKSSTFKYGRTSWPPYLVHTYVLGLDNVNAFKYGCTSQP